MGVFKIKIDRFEWIGGAADARFEDKLLRDGISSISFDDIL